MPIEVSVREVVILGHSPVAFAFVLCYGVVGREIKNAVPHIRMVTVMVEMRENILSMMNKMTPVFSMDLTLIPCLSHNSINSLERSRTGSRVYSMNAPNGLTSDSIKDTVQIFLPDYE